MAWASVTAGNGDGQVVDTCLHEVRSELRSEGFRVGRDPKGSPRPYRSPIARSRLRRGRSGISPSGNSPSPLEELGSAAAAGSIGGTENQQTFALDPVERERRRIARNLHDEAGQYVVGITLRLAALGMRAADKAFADSLQEICTMVAHFGDELRAICAGGRGAVPRGHELLPALDRLAIRWEHEVGIPVRFHRKGMPDPEIDDAVAEVVFRVVQEALTNVAKHAANASKVDIRFEIRAGILSLEIEDDGLVPRRKTKFRPHEQHAHCGIVGMRERVVELGGSFDVKHVSEKGTNVAATIPLRNGATSTGADLS